MPSTQYAFSAWFVSFRGGLPSPGLCGQRRPHRRAVPEAVRRADGYPVGQAGRSLRLDVPRINKLTSMCVYEYPQGRKALGVPGVPGRNAALRNGVENCIMCPSAERTRRRSSPNQSTRTGKNGHVYAPQTLFRSDGIDVRRAGAAYCDHTERSVTTWTLQRPAPIWRHFERRRA